MLKLHIVGILAGVVLASFLSLSDARAQAVYCLGDGSNAGACDYLSFSGDLIVEDNPTTTQCQAHGINFGNIYTFTYRFTVHPNVIKDSLAIFPVGRNADQMISTQSPNFSLNGASTTSQIFINHYGNTNAATPLVSSSNLNIQQGIGGAVVQSTQTIKIVPTSSINNFLAWSDCNVASVKGAAVRIPF